MTFFSPCESFALLITVCDKMLVLSLTLLGQTISLKNWTLGITRILLSALNRFHISIKISATCHYLRDHYLSRKVEVFEQYLFREPPYVSNHCLIYMFVSVVTSLVMMVQDCSPRHCKSIQNCGIIFFPVAQNLNRLSRSGSSAHTYIHIDTYIAIDT